MALVKCMECGDKVSERADCCPKCGTLIKKLPTHKGGILILISIAVIILIGFFSQSDSAKNKPYVSDNSPSDVSHGLRYYAHLDINIREGAGKSHKVVGRLKRGDSVEVKSVGPYKWAEILIAGGQKGYVYEPLLKKHPIP